MLLFSYLSVAQAQDYPSDCQDDTQTIVLNEKTESTFCFDPKSVPENDQSLISDFQTLYFEGLVDKENCLIHDPQNEERENLVRNFIKKNLDQKINVIAVRNPESGRVDLLYTNSESKGFVDSTLSTKDKWKIAAVSGSSIAMGALVSESVFRGQKDKRKHWMVGASISGLTTGMTYYLLETKGLGSKLGLSKTAKKNAIIFSGPVMGSVIGILKEIYDTKHRSIHTPDRRDAGATALGAGISSFAINFLF